VQKTQVSDGAVETYDCFTTAREHNLRMGSKKLSTIRRINCKGISKEKINCLKSVCNRTEETDRAFCNFYISEHSLNKTPKLNVYINKTVSASIFTSKQPHSSRKKR